MKAQLSSLLIYQAILPKLNFANIPIKFLILWDNKYICCQYINTEIVRNVMPYLAYSTHVCMHACRCHISGDNAKKRRPHNRNQILHSGRGRITRGQTSTRIQHANTGGRQKWTQASISTPTSHRTRSWWRTIRTTHATW